MERMTRHAGVHFSRLGVQYSRYFPVCFFLIIFALFLLASCAGPEIQKNPAKGVYHIVKKGETAYGIARAYSITLQDLAESNNISDVSSLKEGSIIFIPDADQVIDDIMAQTRRVDADARRDTGLKSGKSHDRKKSSPPDDVTKGPEKARHEKPVLAEPSGVGSTMPPPREPAGKSGPKIGGKSPVPENKDEVKREKGRFIWPVRGTVKTRFGIQPNKTYHNWIKITCPPGTQVKAAAGGTVIFSAGLKDFGETIIIRHEDDFATVYTHLKKRLVKADQNIKKDEAIALVGQKDDAGDVYINFEIRFKGKARNPLYYLP